MKKIFSIIILLSLGYGGITQEDFRTKSPKSGPAPKIELGEHTTFELDNGLQVIVVENHKLPRVSYQVFVNVPPLKEGEMAGTADLAGDLLSRGTTTKSKAEIDQAVDFIGASMETSASGVYSSCLTKHKDKLLEIISDVMLHPSFPDTEFEKVKKQTISGLASQKDNAEAIAQNVAAVLRNGKDHPYGEVVSETSVNNINVDHCKEYYATYFKPNISYLVIVGDVDTKEVKATANKYFGSWKKGEVKEMAPNMPAKPNGTTVNFVNKNGAVQSVINITYPVELNPQSDDVIKASVMNTMLGAIFSSRLNSNLREDKGYTYGARSSLRKNEFVGHFVAKASVRNEVTDSSIVQFMYELNRIREEKIEDKELNLVKNYMTGSFARSLEKPETVARFALSQARFDLEDNYYATYLQKLNEVTKEDIQAMANKYVTPQNAHILVVGNKDEVADKLATFASDGQVMFYDNYGIKIEADGNVLPEGVTAEVVIDNYIKAIGGKKVLESVKDLSVVMSMEVMGQSMEMEMLQKHPNKFALKTALAGNTLSEQKFDGKKGMTSQMGTTKQLEGKELESMQAQAVMFKELQLENLGYKSTLKGIEDVSGKKAYKVEMVASNGNKTYSFYDMETYLKIRELNMEAGMTITTDLSEYKEVKGVKYPHMMTINGAAPVPMNMKVKECKINSGIEDAVFMVE